MPMEKRRGSRKMSRLVPPTPGLRREGGKFHGLLLVNHVAGLRRMGQTTFFGPASHQYQESAEHHHSQQHRLHLACLLSAAPTSEVRRELFFVFVDAAQNVAQSRVLGLTNGLAGAALELAVARD